MEKIGIRDKHPGSATLYESNYGPPGSLSVSDSYPVGKELKKKLFDTLYRLIFYFSIGEIPILERNRGICKR